MHKIGFFLLCLFVFVQQYGAVNKLPPAKNEFQRYLTQSKHFLKERAEDRALSNIDKAIELSKKNKNFEWQTTALNQKGIIYMAFRKYGKAISVFETAIKLPASNQLCELYNNLGICKFNLGKGYESIQACLQAMKCYEESNKVVKINSTLYMLGWSHTYVGEYDKASYYFLKQLDVLKKDTSQILNITKVYRGLGINASMKGDYKSSKKYLNQALNISYTKQDNVGVFENLSSLASNYSLMKEYESALTYSEKARSKADIINDKGAVLEAEMNKITALIGLKRFHNAASMITKVAKDTTQYYFVPTFRVQYYQNHALAQEGLGNFREALLSQKRLKQYNDSIVAVNNSLGIAQLKNQYDSEKDQNIILAQKTELSKQAVSLKNNMILIIIISFVAVIFIVIIAFSVFLKREKRKRRELLTLKFRDGFDEYLKTKYNLTQQQLDLWLKIVEGVEEAQIAISFFKSGETINRWRRQLYAKLNSVEKTDKHYTKSKAIILYNNEATLYKELSE